MNSAIQLEANQLKKIGIYTAPDVLGYNSLFFHPLTKGNRTTILNKWGIELAQICENDGIEYYYFYNNNKIPPMKINVYPNEIIESWWKNREEQ